MAEESYYTTRKKKRRTLSANAGLDFIKQFGGFVEPTPGHPTPLSANILSGTAGGPPGTLAPNYTLDNISKMADAYATTGGGGIAGGPAAGGGGGVGGAGGIMDPWTGFASRYAGLGGELINSNPEIVLRDQLKAMGLNPDSGMLDLIEEYGPQMQYLAMLGLGTGDPNSYNQGDIINYYADFAKDMMTPGAGSVDFWKLAESVLNAPKDSALSMALTSGSPQEQANTLNNLMMAAMVNMPPIFQRAMADQLEDLTTDWLASKAKGSKGYAGFLSEWLRKEGAIPQ